MTGRVAINGVGVIAPGAVGTEAFRDLLSSGRSAVAPVERWDTVSLSAHCAALVRDFSPKQFIAAPKMRRMNTLSRLAVSAAKLALDDAGPVDGSVTGVAMGSAFGPVQTSIDYMNEYVEKGPSLASPQLFAESVANAPGSHIAIEWGLRGFNMTLTQRESSALAAAMFAASQIVKGTVAAALIGGVEEANEMLFSVLDRLGALAHGEDEMARPFDRRRNGMALGEGSAIMVAAAEPGPRTYGYLSGFGIARDLTASLSDWGDGDAAVVTAMRGAIEDAGIGLREIDAVYASANGSLRGDRLEQRAIARLFGDSPPPVVATKGCFGEYAAAGALQLVAALLAVRDQILHGSCGFEEGEPGNGLDIVRQTRSCTVRNVLVNSLSAGGGIVSAVVSREGV